MIIFSPGSSLNVEWEGDICTQPTPAGAHDDTDKK